MTDKPVINILLIEDQNAVADLISSMLKKSKEAVFEIKKSANLSEGLECLSRESIDTVLLDLTLPDSTGISTVERVHSQKADVPIIVLTGIDDEEMAMQAVRVGAQDYIVKGEVDVHALIRAVLYAIERKRAEEALRKAKDDLEIRVQERTSELQRANESLTKEIEDRSIVEHELRIAHNRLQDTQSQLIEAAKMQVVGGLASGVAHEVKNPLAIILQGVEYIEKKMSTQDKAVNMTLGYIKDAVSRADNIVRGLMDFSSISNLEIESHDIIQVLDKALMLMKHQLDKNHIKVVKEIQDGLPQVMIDKNKIEQVFLNLLMNAADVMPKSGQLKIKAEMRIKNEDKKQFALIISDTGGGMSPELRDRIFDPFFTTKRTQGGTGLGLSIVKNILTMHQAQIEIETQEGKGTTFILTFNI